MNADQIYISGTKYSSQALHGENNWRHIRSLGQQRKGCYTATVDGRKGVITIDASGWWFTELTEHEAGSKPAPKPGTPYPHTAPDGVAVIALQHEVRRARELLSDWLGIDDWLTQDIAPRELVARTRAFIALHTHADVSPAKTQEPA